MSTLIERRNQRKAEAEALAAKNNELNEQIKQLVEQRDKVSTDFFMKNSQYMELEELVKEEVSEACSVDTPPEG